MRLLLSTLYAPLILLILYYAQMPLEEVLYLKAVPMLLALFVTILMIHSYLGDNGLVLGIAKRLKKDIDERESAYINASTKFWIGVALLNVVIHGYLFLGNDTMVWAGYSSVGWYLLFGVAALVQFIHRQTVFIKSCHE
jgi:uncharacterized membrane protein